MLVELTRDMCGFKVGADWLVSDPLALSLIAEGNARNPRDRFGKPLTPVADHDLYPSRARPMDRERMFREGSRRTHHTKA